MKSIRGAISVQTNTEKAILDATHELLEEVISVNSLSSNQIISIIFSCTEDLTAVYPAVEARKMGLTEVSLLCVQEMKVIGSMPMCIRLLMYVNSDKELKSCYLKEAKKLRSDL